MLKKFITRTAVIFLLSAGCTYTLSNMCPIQASISTGKYESTLKLMGETIQSTSYYNIDESAVIKKICEKTIDTYHLNINLSSIRTVSINGSVLEYTDDIGNKWTGNRISISNDKGNDILNLLVNVKLSSVRTSLYNDELKIPEIITDNGQQMYVCSLEKSNITLSNVKTIKIPKSVVALNGLPETTQNCNITFDTTKNLLYCNNIGGSNKNYNIDDINAIINNKDIKIDYANKFGAFQSANIKGKISLTNSNIYIPEECFYNVTGITGIKIGENVKTIDIGKCAFQGCAELKLGNMKINSDMEIGEFAFSTCKVSGNLEFWGNTTIHSGAFYNSIYNDTTFLFNNGNVTLHEYALVGVKGLKQISFGTETNDIEIHAGVFATTKETQNDITSLEFNGGDVILHDGSFSAFDSLKELKFNNKGTLTLKGSPFFGNSELALYIPNNNKMESFPLYENPNLSEITFNCPEVFYNQEDETKLWIVQPDTVPVSYELITVSIENNVSTLAGLSGLKKIICTEKTDEFLIYRSRETNIVTTSPSFNGSYSMKYEISKDDNINEMVFFNPVVIPTVTPTVVATSVPTTIPTVAPTVMPTSQTTIATTIPDIVPTVTPTFVATSVPTAIPTVTPTTIPTVTPTVMPTTQAAVVTTIPAIVPTITPPAKPAATKTKSLLLGAKESIKVSDLKNATYKSNNSKIAVANKKGYIVAKKNGTATITITKKNGTKVAYKVTVKKAPKKVMASFKSKTLKKGKKITLKAKFEKGCYSNTVSFKSSNSKIATVSQKGVITAKKKGTCKITITTYNKKKVTVKITVK